MTKYFTTKQSGFIQYYKKTNNRWYCLDRSLNKYAEWERSVTKIEIISEYYYEIPESEVMLELL